LTGIFIELLHRFLLEPMEAQRSGNVVIYVIFIQMFFKREEKMRCSRGSHWFFILFVAVMLSAERFQRTIKELIVIHHDGSAIITRTAMIAESSLSKTYSIYFQKLEEDKRFFQKLSWELTKEYYFLYGTVPSLIINDLKIFSDGVFNWTVAMKAQNLLSSENGQFITRHKGFGGSEKPAGLLLPEYFENELNDKLFDSAFLGFEKNSAQTTKTTEMILSEGLRRRNSLLCCPHRKTLVTCTWTSLDRVATKRSRKKTSKDYIMRETNETADGTPENLLDKKTSNLVLNYLYIW